MKRKAVWLEYLTGDPSLDRARRAIARQVDEHGGATLKWLGATPQRTSAFEAMMSFGELQAVFDVLPVEPDDFIPLIRTTHAGELISNTLLKFHHPAEVAQ